MDPTDLLAAVASRLEQLGIDYLITGSMAATVFGEPRFTNDIDIVIRITPDAVGPLCESFPEGEYYFNADAARDAVRAHAQFNVIHPASGYKIDFMVAEPSAFNDSRFSRAVSIEVNPGAHARFASPEDVILRKLQYFREGQSDKHLRDIRGILRLAEPPIDAAYIAKWAATLGVEDEWQLAQQRTP